MSFGEELRKLSSNVSLEIQVWEKMKPYLTEIAKSGHPKGCHVVFEGETKQFRKKMEKVAEDDDIFFEYCYRDPIIGGPNYGDIIWEKSKFWNGMCYGQRDMSDKLLRVILNKSGEVSIEIEKLEEKYKNECLYTYIS